MKHNIVNSDLKGQFYNYRDAANHGLEEIFFDTVETAGNSLYECLMSAVVFLQDYHGNKAGSVYASELSDKHYNEIEKLIASEVNGASQEAI